MGKVRIVTDSTAYLPDDIIEDFGITVVPLVVNFEKESFPENRDKDCHVFYEKLTNSEKIPTTSQPAVGEFFEQYKRLTQDGSSVISIHLSGKLSGTVQSARTAAAMLPERNISVVDSRFTISAMLYFVREAAAMANAGCSKEDILDKIAFMKSHTRLFFLVDSLQYLHRGGRIGGAAAVFGTLLQIKPILHLDEGIINVYRKVRTKEKAMQLIIDEIDREIKNGQCQDFLIAVIHVDNLEGADSLKSLLQQKRPKLQPDTFFVGPVIGSHVGPGSIGVSITRVGKD
ncbi:MAG: DegV family protein [Desulfitobacteriaceae bacterium]|nr:DegV family protein [Desulfitobacteriaceae bacterium]